MKRSDRIRRNLGSSDKQLHKEGNASAGELTIKERIEVSTERAEQLRADTKNALKTPSELTPLEAKRLARSEAIKQQRQDKRTTAQPAIAIKKVQPAKKQSAKAKRIYNQTNTRHSFEAGKEQERERIIQVIQAQPPGLPYPVLIEQITKDQKSS